MESPNFTGYDNFKDYYQRMREFENRTGKDVMAMWNLSLREEQKRIAELV